MKRLSDSIGLPVDELRRLPAEDVESLLAVDDEFERWQVERLERELKRQQT